MLLRIKLDPPVRNFFCAQKLHAGALKHTNHTTILNTYTPLETTLYIHYLLLYSRLMSTAPVTATSPVRKPASVSTQSPALAKTSPVKPSTAAAVPATVIKAAATVVASARPVAAKSVSTVSGNSNAAASGKKAPAAPMRKSKKDEAEEAEKEEEEESGSEEEEEDDEEEDIEEDEERSDEEENDDELEEVDHIGNRSVCLLCTLETDDMQAMFTSKLETDESKRERILCVFCYNVLLMSFQVQGTCMGEHQDPELEGIFLPPEVALKRQEDVERPVSFDELRKTPRYCFDCIQDHLPWTTEQIKTLRRAYRMIKSIAKNCPICFENSVTVTNRGAHVRLCDLCVEDFQRAKEDEAMCLMCRQNTAVLCKGLSMPGRPRDICFVCLKRLRAKRLLENAEMYRQKRTAELVARLERENDKFCDVHLLAYLQKLEPEAKAAKAAKASKAAARKAAKGKTDTASSPKKKGSTAPAAPKRQIESTYEENSDDHEEV